VMVENESVSSTELVEPANEAEIEPAIEPEIEVSTPVVRPSVKLRFRFSEDCWVEVADSQKRLLFGMQKAGADVSVDAVGSISLLLGNAAAVELEVDGAAYQIPKNRRSSSKTARFELAE